jgi:hypothetical protein
MIRFDSFLYRFRNIEFALLTKFKMMRARPQTPLVGKKKKFSLFLGFDFSN